jgi:hypothetical protein
VIERRRLLIEPSLWRRVLNHVTHESRCNRSATRKTLGKRHVTPTVPEAEWVAPSPVGHGRPGLAPGFPKTVPGVTGIAPPVHRAALMRQPWLPRPGVRRDLWTTETSLLPRAPPASSSPAVPRRVGGIPLHRASLVEVHGSETKCQTHLPYAARLAARPKSHNGAASSFPWVDRPRTFAAYPCGLGPGAVAAGSRSSPAIYI